MAVPLAPGVVGSGSPVVGGDCFWRPARREALGRGCARRQRAAAVRVVLFLGLFSGVLVPAEGAAAQGSATDPPAGCVVALGALVAGSVVSEEGSWDGDDGCRSANAGGGARFARFLSFTVSVPLEARFSLSSSKANRLFLLEGAGTGGRVLASAGAERATWFASFWRVLQPGSYTLEATTRHTEQEGEFTVEVDSMALSPADSCTASLGAVAAGAAVSHSGAWDRGDGCRSVNATADRESRYYADYVSFTVSEAVEVSVRLSGAGGKRLYLLQGAGAGGRVVASASERRGGPVALRRTLAPGAYTLETAAYSPTREAAYTLTVAAAPVPPTAGDAIAAREIQARPGAARVELSAAFAGTVDSYTAASSDTSVLTATVDGSVLTLNGAKTGTATVTVTATNTAGSAAQSFTVTVSAVTAPEPEGALAARTLPAGASVEVDVSAGFSGAVDSYTAASSDTSIATVSVNGPALTLTGAKAGAATVTVTAANTAGSATQTMAVSVTSAAPAAVGSLAARTLTAGGSAAVDVSGAFSGTVDSYTVTSSDGSVVGVALAGPVVTLTGVAAGTATVTVVAANAAGSASQTMAVTVGLPPPPALGAPLAAQALQVTETLTVDVASGFAGRIDAYTAVAGDTDKLTVAVDGAEVVLTGVRAGDTTVTVTAVNAAGRAARSFAVIVDPLTPPRAAGAPVARTIAVGEELPVHVADAFSGVIRHYRATSNAPSIVTVGVDGPKVTLAGAAAGTATVTLQAVNDAGAAAQTLAVTVKVPQELAVAVNAPSHCLGSEGTLAPGGGRRGVGTIRLTYHVTGGAPPYTVTSPDSPDTAAEPTGALTVPCSRRGVDLATAGLDVNVVEAGPRTLTVTATDNTGATTSADIRVEVAEDAYTTEYNGGLMHPGRTYVLGTPDQWVLLTLPEGLTLRFEGLSEHNTARFTEPATGAELVLEWTTGKEVSRSLPTTRVADRALATDAAEPNTLFDQLTIGKPNLTYGAGSDEWRPYKGLHPETRVAVHPSMVYGQPISVCNLQSSTDFKRDIKKGIDAWNSIVRGQRPEFGRELFRWQDSCPRDRATFVEVRYVSDGTIDRFCSPPSGAPAACAVRFRRGNNPPTIVSGNIYISWSYTSLGGSVNPNGETVTAAEKQRVMIEELGHFLGLGDYYNTNSDSCKVSDHYRSVMASDDCKMYSIQPRDLKDLHAVYHPDKRLLMSFVQSGSDGWRLYAGSPPPDSGDSASRAEKEDEEEDRGKYRYVSNAERYVVFGRAAASADSWEYRGWFSRDFVGSWLDPGEAYEQDEDGRDVLVQSLSIGGTVADITGREFAVFGITRGDIEQRSRRAVERLATWKFEFDDEAWSLGTPALVYGPPAKPLDLTATADSQRVVLSWSSVPGATHYDVYVYRSGLDTTSRVEEVAADPSSCTVRATIGNLARQFSYDFRVGARRVGVPMRSELSAKVTARLLPSNSRTTLNASASSEGGAPAANGAGGGGSCTVPVEVDPLVEVSGACPEDGRAWSLRAVAGGFVCDRLDSVPATPGERVAGCPRVEPRYEVVDDGGVEKCRRTLSAKPSESLGPPECEAGFAPADGGLSCSRTDSVPASATRSCSRGYRLVTYSVGPGAVGYRCERSVAATAATVYSCGSGYSLVRVPLAGWECRKSVAATASVTRSCSAGYRLVTYFVGPGAVGYRCERSVPATAATTYSCGSGYSLVRVPLAGWECRKSVAATASVTRSCSAGYRLVTYFVGPGVVGYRCERSVAATAATVYSCGSGYSLVRIPLGGQYCRKTTPATAAYSCGSGYTLSGRSCYKYTYTNPTGTSCPAGYTLVYNGIFSQCRKKLTADAAVTYSCSSGRLSGTDCILTATPTAKTTYSCSSGRLSGTDCILTATPTAKTTYSCSSGRLSGTDCILTATPTAKTTYSCSSGRLSGTDCILTATPTAKTTYSCSSGRLSGTDCILTATPTAKTTYSCSSGRLSGSDCILTGTLTVTYDCDDAPPGYTLSGTDCTKTITRAPTRPTVYTCPGGYDRDEPPGGAGPPTCTKTDTTNATITTTPASCPAVAAGETPYRLYEDHYAGGVKRTCERIVTTDAEITRTYTCPPNYRLETTTASGDTDRTCRLDKPA